MTFYFFLHFWSVPSYSYRLGWGSQTLATCSKNTEKKAITCTMGYQTQIQWVRSQCSTNEPSWQVWLMLLSYLTYPIKRLGMYIVASLPGAPRPVGAGNPPRQIQHLDYIATTSKGGHNVVRIWSFFLSLPCIG